MVPYTQKVRNKKVAKETVAAFPEKEDILGRRGTVASSPPAKY